MYLVFFGVLESCLQFRELLRIGRPNMKGNEKETYRAHAKQTTKLTGERANDAILLKQSRSLGPLDAFFVDTSEVPEWNFERKRARSKKKARRTHLKEARRVSSIAQPCFAHSIS